MVICNIFKYYDIIYYEHILTLFSISGFSRLYINQVLQLDLSNFVTLPTVLYGDIVRTVLLNFPGSLDSILNCFCLPLNICNFSMGFLGLTSDVVTLECGSFFPSTAAQSTTSGLCLTV